ncbi:MAG TPA: nitronate monooxygenase [Pseudonocardiaceae bacterium]|nr:nitronate monooxygenase [Pseudonocardiaceae bacterium]
MSLPLSDLGVTNPVLAAPMAGGPGTPTLVAAAPQAGSLGFLPAGYRNPQVFAEQLAAVRAAGAPFGVNLFAPNPLPVDPVAYRAYAYALRADADRYGIDLPDEPVEDDDHWAAKIDLLLADPAPVTSFTFGVPEASVVAALRKTGTVVVQTVTSADEAVLAAEAGVDALAVQSSAAGGHWGTLTPLRPPAAVGLVDLVASVRSVVSLPLVGAGGIASSGDVAAVLRAGATAVMVGTALLLSDESGASAVHRAALGDPSRDRTVVTRAFSGRPARGLRNSFTDRFSEQAPVGYPAVHYLTSPLRRAAAAAGDAELVNLWAGTGYRSAAADSAALILTRLAGG